MMILSKLASLICNSIIGLKSQQSILKNAASPSPRSTFWNVLKSIKEGLMSSSSQEVPYEEAESHDDGGECCCCICLMQMEIGGGSDLEMLPCQHKFHKVCIERWLMRKRRRTCPLCRFSMVEDEDEEVQEYLTEEMLIWFSSFHVAGF